MSLIISIAALCGAVGSLAAPQLSSLPSATVSLTPTSTTVFSDSTPSPLPTTISDSIGDCEQLNPYTNPSRITYGTTTQLEACQKQFDNPIYLAEFRRSLRSMATDTLDYHASLPYLNQVQKINYESEVRSIADDTSITTYVGLVNKVRELGQTLGFKTLPNIGSCGSAFHVIQPWALVASPTVSGKAPTVTIAEASIAAFNVMDFSIFLDEGGFNRFFQTSVPNGVSSYKGYVVESINGKAPLDLAKDIFAGDKVIGPSSAFSSAVFFNRTLSIQNGFLSQWDRPYMSTFFQKDVSYKLRNPTTNAVVELTVPWLVAPDDDYFVSENFSIVFNAVLPRCFAISSSSVAMGSDVEPISTHPIDVLTHRPTRRLTADPTLVHRLSKRQSESALSASLRAAMPNLPANSERPLFAYLVDSTTMAIMLSTENPYPIDAESDSGEFESYQTAYFTALAADVRRVREQNPGVKNLIIDVTRGSWQCDHHVIIKYLLGDFKPLEYTVRLTPPVERILSSKLDARFDILFNPDFNGNSRMRLKTTENVTFTINSEQHKFSPRFYLTRCDKFERKYAGYLPSLGNATFTKANTIIVSDGNCFYGCDEFMHIARTQFNLKTYVYGRTTKTPFPPSLTFYHSFAASVLSNTHSNILPISTSAWPSRAWSFRANARIPAMNVFEPDSPVEAGTVPVNMVKAVDADGILEGMLYGDWPMNVWKVAAGRMVEGKKSKSWRVEAGFGFVFAAITAGIVAFVSM